MKELHKKSKVIDAIFRYDNFLFFLEDYIAEKQKKNKNFSKRYFAQKAGFSSHSHLVHILNGRRRATDDSIEKIVNVLELSDKDKSYFFSLVKYNQSQTVADRDKYFVEMNKIREKIEYSQYDKSMTRFYTKWYNPVIRELIVYSQWDNDYSKLAKLVTPEISEREAKETVELLLELKIVYSKDNRYFLSDETVEAGEIDVVYLKKARKDMILASIDAADTNSPEERFYNNLTLNLDKKSYDIIRELTKNYVENIENIIMGQDEELLERVYQLNIQMFPLSKVYK